jgi:uracil-DNA glycosylase family protein
VSKNEREVRANPRAIVIDGRATPTEAVLDAEGSASAPLVPRGPHGQVAPLKLVARAARACTACPLWQGNTQTVFGEGRSDAHLMLIGEQPGDREDRMGHPFVGPAGLLLDQVLVEAGIDRQHVYVTNVVKHFSFVPRGGKRIHQKPKGREILACRGWLVAEIEAVRPRLIVCLGATAAQAMLGRSFRLTQARGQVLESAWGRLTCLATYHPSALLRAPDSDARRALHADLVADLRVAGRFVGSPDWVSHQQGGRT